MMAGIFRGELGRARVLGVLGVVCTGILQSRLLVILWGAGPVGCRNKTRV
jgi:hypothetical protein